MSKRFGRVHLTATIIGDLRPGQILMDTDEPAFGVRRQKGKRVFFLRKWANGARHFETIGEYATGGLTVTNARKEASDRLAVIRNGQSPAAQRARARTIPTINELADVWLKEHVDAKRKQSTAKLYRVLLRTHVLPVLGKLRVDQVAEVHVDRMHAAASGSPYCANRAVAVLSSLMAFAERRKFRVKNSNPARELERFKEEKRERFLSWGEIDRVWSALCDPVVTAKHSVFALAAIGLLLLTGMRRNEVLHLRWKEVDLERRLLLLGDSKTGKKPVILSEHAAELIANIPRINEWVFPGDRPNCPEACQRRGSPPPSADRRACGCTTFDIPSRA